MQDTDTAADLDLSERASDPPADEVPVYNRQSRALRLPGMIGMMAALGVLPPLPERYPVTAEGVRDLGGDDPDPVSRQRPRVSEPIPFIAPMHGMVTADAFRNIDVLPAPRRQVRTQEQQSRRKRNKTSAASRRKNRGK